MPGLVALALAYVFSQFYRSFLAVITPQLTLELGATKSDLSTASGLWFLTFALMQFVVGINLDRFGPRRTCGWIFGIAGVGGALLFAMATDPWQIKLAMGLLGIGCAPVLMAAFFVFTRQFEPARFAILASWIVAFGNLGNVVGTTPMAFAAEAFGWRTTLLALAAGNLLVAMAILVLVREFEHDATPSDGLRGYGRLLRLPELWRIFPIILLAYATVAGIRGLWVGPYLEDLYAANSLQIGRITFWMALAMIAGSLIYGPMDRVLNSRKWVVIPGSLIMLIVLGVLTVQPQQSLRTTTLLLIGIGLGGTSYGVLMAHGRSFIPASLTGRGITLLNFFSIAGVSVLQFLTGAVVARQTDTSSPATYQLLFGTYTVLLAIAIAIYMTSRDARPGVEAD